jgi:hypothetical protein
VIARAKIEAKKHFESFPLATDADQQVWIEEKVRLDFERILDRLAAQLNSEIVGIAPFQIGFADYYYNRATNPQLASLDDETIKAARLIVSVLPALTESVVSQRHQCATDMLLHALAQNAPQQEVFLAAISVLAQDYQVLLGLDKLMGNLFLPKTGPQLARKRTGNESEQSGSGGFPYGAYSSTPHGAPIWHWKEPATIANSTRYNSPSTKAPAATNGEFVDTVAQPYHQDPLPSPMVVQAEVFRPPPPPPQYYQYPYMKHYQQAYTPNRYSAPTVSQATFGNYYSNVNYENEAHWNAPSLQQFETQPSSEIVQNPEPRRLTPTPDVNNVQFEAQPSSDLVQYPEPGPLAPTPDVKSVPNGNDDATQEHLSATSSTMVSPPANSHTTLNGTSTEKRLSLTKTTNEATAELSISPGEVTSVTSPPSAENSRRRSSRGTILTSKARAAGILLGTKVDSVDHTSFDKTSKVPRACTKSTLPVASVEQHQVPVSNRSGSLKKSEPERPTESVKRTTIGSNCPQVDHAGENPFVPRSSGRERKPTAKIIASSAVRPAGKGPDYATSMPRVSPRLRLSISSRSSTPSEKSATEAGATRENGSLPSVVNGQASAKETLVTRDTTRKPDAPDAKTKDQLPMVPVACIELVKDISQHNLPSASRKHKKFLTNDKGQSMSQALLQLAQVAADWSDSDDDEADEDEAETELSFQEKLNQALQKHTLQSKPHSETNGTGYMSSQGLLSAATASTTDFNRPVPPGYHDLRPVQGYAVQSQAVPGQWYQQGPILTPLQSMGTQVLHSQGRIGHQPMLLPRTNNSSTGVAIHPAVDPISNSQMTNDWLSLMKLKDKAKSRGLHIGDNMGLDRLTNLRRAHNAGELDVASKPGLKTITPTPVRVSAMSQTQQSGHRNGNANGHHYGSSPGIPPSQFYPQREQHTSPYSLSVRAVTDSNTPQQAVPGHVQDIVPNVRGSPKQTAPANGLNNPVIAEPRITGPLVPSRSTAQHTSRYDFNPQGLNGGPPGGGTIINVPETRRPQPRKKRGSKAQAHATSNNGNADETRQSTPSTREGYSGTPLPRASTPQVSVFKKGGIVLSFGKTATRPAAA